jgi:nucleoside-diphosphate-sugar epimerase
VHKLILGCGYVGLRVARQWRDAGCDVHVVTRSDARATQLAAEGLRPLVGDVTLGDRFPELPPCETMLYAIGFDRQAGKSMDTVYVEGLRTTLDHLNTPPGRIIYLSSTGVYGEAPPPSWGENPPTELDLHPWMDESSPCQPTREGGVVCLQAENVLRSHPWADRTTILRLAGIYGPGRIPRREQILSREGLAVPTEGYLNLIHVEDAVRVILAAERSEIAAGNLYVVADGHPVPRIEYYAELARCFGAPPPVLTTPPPDDPARQRSACSKRLRNTKMLRELAVELAYPSYREGLAAIIAASPPE